MWSQQIKKDKIKNTSGKSVLFTDTLPMTPTVFGTYTGIHQVCVEWMNAREKLVKIFTEEVKGVGVSEANGEVVVNQKSIDLPL